MAKLKFPAQVPKEVCKATLDSVADALYVISGKWKLPIIVVLGHGSMRFNEMQRMIEGISAKVLSKELKDLELNGFVRRIVTPSTPVVVAYELTRYSDTLGDVLEALSKWGKMHKEEVKKSMRKRKAG